MPTAEGPETASTTTTRPTRAGASPSVTRARRLAAVGLAVALTAGLAGCGGDETSDEARPAQTLDVSGDEPAPTTGDGDGEAPPETAGGTPDATALPTSGLALEPVVTVGFPTSMVARPGTDQLYLTDKAGQVRRLERDAGGGPTDWRLADEPVLDVAADTDPEGERGLLGLAFSPDGSQLATYRTDLEGTLTIEVTAMAGDVADPSTTRTVLTVEHPRPNHNGGQLVTGPDGLLYAGLGDGGGAGDPDDNGQDPTTLLGTIVRIDPWGGGDPYVVPDDNPFASGTDADGRAGAPEVWAWGLRNPWRFSFDRASGDLWIGDVGQNAWEEVDLLPAAPGGAGRGANLGWSELEATHPFDGGVAPEGAVPPVFEYDRSSGECSVTGGYVYRGQALPSLRGVYVYADLCRPEVRGILPGGDELAEGPLGIAAQGGIVSFAEDADGELYVLTSEGQILAVVPDGA